MPEEGFLRRWARVKATGADAVAEAAPPAPPAPAAPAAPEVPFHQGRWVRAGEIQPVPPEEPAAIPAREPSGASASPTIDDVAQLTPQSDYSIFVGQGVDKSVQRLALKKLFADPHFNVMDRLDMYMDDYNIPSPVSAEMLASLDHARSSLRRFVEDVVAADPAPGPALASIPDSDASDAAAEPGEAAGPQANSFDSLQHETDSHNEATHAGVAHEEVLSGAPACVASAHDAGLSHRPNPHLPQGQA